MLSDMSHYERTVLRGHSWPKEQINRFLEGIGQATNDSENTDEQVDIASEKSGNEHQEKTGEIHANSERDDLLLPG